MFDLEPMQQYSLHQRFQGALLGSATGQMYLAESSIGNWQVSMQHCSQWLCHPTAQPPPQLSNDALQATLTLLPLWLYCHESWRQRQRWLTDIPDWQAASTNQSTIWLYGEAIAQVLRTDCQPQQLLQKLLQRWQQHTRSGAPPLTETWQQQLIQLQQWQHDRRCLAEIQSALANHTDPERTLTISLLCFLQNPWDISLAIARATQLIGTATPTLGGLLGGLFGAYGGWMNLPIQSIEALIVQGPSHTRSIDQNLGHVSNFSMIPFAAVAQQLIQAWSGNIQSSTMSPNSPTRQATVATVLPPR
jgi:hypothetical protein